MKRWLAALAFALVATAAFGQADEIDKPNPATEERLKQLAEELRCLVCQNQTIADSNAPLALDLRNQIRDQIAKGRSDDQIREYMVDRYGDFVLYRPPFKATTVLLWAGPLLLLLVGAFAFWRVVSKRRGAALEPQPGAAPPQRRAEIEALLEGREPPATRASSGAPSGRRSRP